MAGNGLNLPDIGMVVGKCDLYVTGIVSADNNTHPYETTLSKHYICCQGNIRKLSFKNEKWTPL
jgi:hypothetical protein